MLDLAQEVRETSQLVIQHRKIPFCISHQKKLEPKGTQTPLDLTLMLNPGPGGGGGGGGGLGTCTKTNR